MCRLRDSQSANEQPSVFQSVDNRRTRRRLCGDPVRSVRFRTFIEQTVISALGMANRPTALEGIADAARGGASLVFARQVALYLAHVGCGLTYTEAAQLYGRHRTTAAHACAVVEDSRDDPVLDRTIELLENYVRLGARQIEPRIAGSLHTL